MLMTLVEDSPRAGGGYQIEDAVSERVKALDQKAKARLTTWIVDKNAQRVRLPEITQEIVEYAKWRQPLPVHERATRLLRWIAGESSTIGTRFDMRRESPEAYAWSESTLRSEIFYLADYLTKANWIYTPNGTSYSTLEGYLVPAIVIVTVEGHTQISSQVSGMDSSQGFIAMWFDESMKDASDKGIEPAIRDAGYKPLRIDKVDNTNKIDDEIIAQIRRSKFVVANLTYGKGGPRGGVYYEAGFAFGLNKEVFFSCRKDRLRNVHFDTRQFPHIVWETPEELREALANRIRAVLGQGPEALP